MYSSTGDPNERSEGHEIKETPRPIMMRTVKLQQAYAELKNDLLEEVNAVDTRIIKPAMDAKDHIQPLKKVIKKRADKKAWINVALPGDCGADSDRWISRNTSRALTRGGRI